MKTIYSFFFSFLCVLSVSGQNYISINLDTTNCYLKPGDINSYAFTLKPLNGFSADVALSATFGSLSKTRITSPYTDTVFLSVTADNISRYITIFAKNGTVDLGQAVCTLYVANLSFTSPIPGSILKNKQTTNVEVSFRYLKEVSSDEIRIIANCIQMPFLEMIKTTLLDTTISTSSISKLSFPVFVNTRSTVTVIINTSDPGTKPGITTTGIVISQTWYIRDTIFVLDSVFTKRMDPIMNIAGYATKIIKLVTDTGGYFWAIGKSFNPPSNYYGYLDTIGIYSTISANPGFIQKQINDTLSKESWIDLGYSKSDPRNNFTCSFDNISIDSKNNKWLSISDHWRDQYSNNQWGDDGRGIIELTGNNNVVRYTNANSQLSSDTVSSIAYSKKDGSVWFATVSGIAKFDGKFWTLYSRTDLGVSTLRRAKIAIDRDGEPWVSNYSEIVRKKGSAWLHEAPLWLPSFNYGAPIFSPDSIGNMVLVYEGFLYLHDGQKWNLKMDPAIWDSTSLGSNDLLVDRSGVVWVATDSGLFKYKNDSLTYYGRPEGLGMVGPLALDKMGNLLIYNEPTSSSDRNLYGFLRFRGASSVLPQNKNNKARIVAGSVRKINFIGSLSLTDYKYLKGQTFKLYDLKGRCVAKFNNTSNNNSILDFNNWLHCHSKGVYIIKSYSHGSSLK